MEATIRFGNTRPAISFAINVPSFSERSAKAGKGKLKQTGDFILYRLLATPSAWVYLKAKYDHKIVNAELLARYRNTGYFLYGNRTGTSFDAMVPSMISFPKKSYVVVEPKQISGAIFEKVAPSLGALPLPESNKAAGAFLKAVETRLNEKNAMVIYPETTAGIGSLSDFACGAFRYPIKSGAPSFCFTNVLCGKRLVTYLDGPFYPDRKLSAAAQSADLQKRIRETMERRMKENN